MSRSWMFYCLWFERGNLLTAPLPPTDLPALAPGQAYVVTDSGSYITNSNGAFIIADTGV